MRGDINIRQETRRDYKDIVPLILRAFKGHQSFRRNGCDRRFPKKAASKYGLICAPLIFAGSMITYITQTQNPGIWPSIYFSLRNCVPTATCILLSCIVLEYLPQTSAVKTKKPLSDKSVNSDDRVEALTKLKQLLDSGVITQEEFEAKKKQILGV